MRAVFLSILLSCFLLWPNVALSQERSATRQGFDLQAQSGQTILVFRPAVQVGSQSMGGMFEPDADWTLKARDHIAAALKEQQSKLGNTILEAPEAYGEDAELLYEYQMLFGAVAEAVREYQFFVGNRLPTKKRDNKDDIFDWSLGPGVADLPGAADADYALFIYNRDEYGSTGRKILQVGLALFGGIGVQSGVHVGYAGLVDLKTGNLLWINVDGQMGGDVREADGAQKRVRQLLEEFPGSELEK
ncbi:hypothetical protein MWU38_10295 [Qipengyuania sp. S6317L1]|uniref:hypothetical protein n=1 Tax=Qipengyuania sp. S6317L1 TaxID=2926410 RepID=UPI001FF622BD|nr:hypothetical protein [Qipengyuania sp. S6317L1]MCK0099774.1 hypothetical protein [Qipengyuania sp. S6317L1]